MQSPSNQRPFFATAARGTEGALRDELRELRLPAVRATRGGVHFGGGLEHAIRACLRSRVASRVLWHQASFPARDPDAVYAGVAQLDWSTWLDNTRTLGVFSTIRKSRMTHSGFLAQKIKDAIVDQLRERTGRRPDVDPNEPDLRVVARLDRDRLEILLDLAGLALGVRGYRTEGGQAPLRENLAAGLLRLAGFAPGTPVLDPMCGSGTLAIEAAGWAGGRLPSPGRTFGFERWRSFDASWEEALALERGRAEQFMRNVPTQVQASDRDRRALARARSNAERAGVSIEFERIPLAERRPPPPGTLVVTNPPYGHRLALDRDWHVEFGRFLERARGATVVALSADRSLPEHVGRAATGEHTLFNGNLECRLFRWAPS